MSEKIVDVTGKYSLEIQSIANKLNQLENGRVYDLTKVQGDGYLFNNISQLKKMLGELIYKIEYGKDSAEDEMSKIFK
ncbi:hypothetical protein [Schinkia azotoformans]|uniref:hypothetical protein n=1 Tax=Schinkia azotoformans TaxID=1454 RepID=UPI002DB8499F|nr:hypothetical protein [Schinkia azotoformans]MEC1788618.1 hypothetical protein [Schinkia azotoformans]MED4419937.1 hypothetical protein [Schinkia azotoformans]